MKTINIALVVLITMLSSCEDDDIPSYPGAGVLIGEWRGTITFYFTEYPLSLSVFRVRNDSINGRMVIEFYEGLDTVTINSGLYFTPDSMGFDLNAIGNRMCTFKSMFGRLVSSDSLSGEWDYRCINDFGFRSPWGVHRFQ